MSKKREIRIFISSPNELFPERELCDKVIDEMNRMLGNRFNVFFSSYRWEKTARAVGMGNPQSRTERVENYDLYFGILWKPFEDSSLLFLNIMLHFQNHQSFLNY